jgi:hypothetical protein
MLICGNKAERNLNQPLRRMDCRIKSGNDEQIRKKGNGTPADAHGMPARNGARGAPRRRRLAPPFRFGRAHLPAFHSRHLRQRPNATAQLQFTHFLGRNY